MNTPPATQQTTRSSTAYSQQSTLVQARPPSEALNKALQSFRKRLTLEEIAKYRITTYDELCADISQLQCEQENRKEMMNLSRIQAFLEGMQQLGKTIEIFLNVSDVVAFVWGPVKFLLLVW
jgi:hypothetical protein